MQVYENQAKAVQGSTFYLPSERAIGIVPAHVLKRAYELKADVVWKHPQGGWMLEQCYFEGKKPGEVGPGPETTKRRFLEEVAE